METEKEYHIALVLLDELKDIDDSDERCDEFNTILDKVIAYENENNIEIARV